MKVWIVTSELSDWTFEDVFATWEDVVAAYPDYDWEEISENRRDSCRAANLKDLSARRFDVRSGANDHRINKLMDILVQRFDTVTYFPNQDGWVHLYCRRQGQPELHYIAIDQLAVLELAYKQTSAYPQWSACDSRGASPRAQTP